MITRQRAYVLELGAWQTMCRDHLRGCRIDYDIWYDPEDDTTMYEPCDWRSVQILGAKGFYATAGIEDLTPESAADLCDHMAHEYAAETYERIVGHVREVEEEVEMRKLTAEDAE